MWIKFTLYCRALDIQVHPSLAEVLIDMSYFVPRGTRHREKKDSEAVPGHFMV